MTFGFKKLGDVLHGAFPTPEYLTLNPVGIDIASDAIYFMKLKKSREGLVPDKFEKIPFGKNIEINETLNAEDRKIVVESLIKLKKKFNFEYIISSLSEQKTYIFSVLLPKEATKDIPSFIRYQIEDNVPLPAIDVNFQYYLIDQENKKDDIRVVVSVFPKQIINIYTDIFAEAKLFPISFFPESGALSRALVKENDNTSYLLVRILSGRVSVSVLESGIIRYTTDLLINTDNVFANIQGPEAISLKETLNKVLIYWFTSKKDLIEHKKIENVLLVGHNADNPQVIDFLERSLKINVDVANVWTNCFDLKKHVPEIDQKTSLDYAVAIGLAVKSINYA